jgi:E3 ubiquitin-protein ligase RGLG
MGRTLESFDEDNLIPMYGFGDIVTKNRAVFNLLGSNESCNGFEEVLQVYNKKTPYIQLSGPTSFAPIIYEAIRLVQLDNTYHILVIIADGQVSNPDIDIAAITEASQYPLSIIMVGVGDGPWDTMKCFDDQLTESKFDNFQFVNYTEIKKEYGEYSNIDAIFAMNALMEIPMQYKFIKENGLINTTVATEVLLDIPPAAPPNSPIGYSGPENNICAICLETRNDHVFQCGHMICGGCKDSIETCHICRENIQTITKVYM